MRESLVAAVKEVNKQVDTKNMKPAEIVLAYHEYLKSTVEYDASGIKDYSTVYGRDHKYDMSRLSWQICDRIIPCGINVIPFPIYPDNIPRMIYILACSRAHGTPDCFRR